MNEEHEKFGTNCAGSRWFNGKPEIKEKEIIPVRQIWKCPIENCGGEMEFNGMEWPTANPGYHHTCNRCGFTAALRMEKYPRIAYKDKNDL